MVLNGGNRKRKMGTDYHRGEGLLACLILQYKCFCNLVSDYVKVQNNLI